MVMAARAVLVKSPTSVGSRRGSVSSKKGLKKQIYASSPTHEVIKEKKKKKRKSKQNSMANYEKVYRTTQPPDITSESHFPILSGHENLHSEKQDFSQSGAPSIGKPAQSLAEINIGNINQQYLHPDVEYKKRAKSNEGMRAGKNFV